MIPVASSELVLKRAERYQGACYLVWLRRPDMDLTAPARSQGEEIILGTHIRAIKRLIFWFKSNNLPLPELQEYPQPPYGIDELYIAQYIKNP